MSKKDEVQNLVGLLTQTTQQLILILQEKCSMNEIKQLLKFANEYTHVFTQTVKSILRKYYK